VDKAHRLGFQHEVAARRIQRQWKLNRNDAAAREAEAAEEELRRAIRLEHIRQRHAAKRLQLALRRRRAWKHYKQRRLAEITATMRGRKAEERTNRFLRELTERVYRRRRAEDEAARVIGRTYRALTARKARKLRRKAEELRAHRAVRIIQKRWLTYKILSLQKYAQGLLSKRSRKGKWQERFFYIHKGNLAYLPKRKLPQPKAEAAMRKATLRWDETGAPPAKARVLDDVRQIRADAAEREFEVIMASGQRHSYRAANEFDMRLWKGVFDKFIRYHDLYGPGGKSASSVAEVASRVAPGRQPRGGVQGGESRAEGRRPPPPAAR